MSNSMNKSVIYERKTREEYLEQKHVRGIPDLLIEQASAPRILKLENVAALEDLKCSVCGKEFLHNKTRNSHMKKMHNIVNDSKKGRPAVGGVRASNARYYDKTKQRKKIPLAPKTPKQIKSHESYIKQKKKQVKDYLMGSISNMYQGKNLDTMYGGRANQQTDDADSRYIVKMGEQYEELFRQNGFEDTHHNRWAFMKIILSSLSGMFPHFISASYVKDEVLPIMALSDIENLAVPLGQESESTSPLLCRFLRHGKGKRIEVACQLLALDYIYYLFARKEFDFEKITDEYPTLYSLFNKHPF